MLSLCQQVLSGIILVHESFLANNLKILDRVDRTLIYELYHDLSVEVCLYYNLVNSILQKCDFLKTLNETTARSFYVRLSPYYLSFDIDLHFKVTAGM